MFRGLLSRLDKRARLPEGLRIYAIGDLHGCADLLENAFAIIDDDLAQSPASQALHVFLGDYVDRGPQVKRTIDLLIGRAREHRSVFIRGNHEALLWDFLSDPSLLTEWLQLGGATTLMSYGVSAKVESGDDVGLIHEAFRAAIPQSHVRFFSALAPSFGCGDFFFAHAGVRPGVALEQQSERDLMWIREPFLSSSEDFGKVVIHGHTPVQEPDIRNHRVNIDTGAYATGRLTILSIEDHQLDFLFSTRE
jgi:serine/threonine protein phosphatase 1